MYLFTNATLCPSFVLYADRLVDLCAKPLLSCHIIFLVLFEVKGIFGFEVILLKKKFCSPFFKIGPDSF